MSSNGPSLQLMGFAKGWRIGPSNNGKEAQFEGLIDDFGRRQAEEGDLNPIPEVVEAREVDIF